ncbi:hypothetical protein [Pseudomonas fluorescens]|uniref:hypothetical protein n=1 Tax=Pseudomonas fluorescens TaxID=294 RepID=UPI00123FC9E6|nr:hypothetical protein [Pseudomonas fluorescens]
MAKTILRVRFEGVAFYVNQVSTGSSTGGGRRFALSKTSQYSGVKEGWVKLNATECTALESIVGESELFKACTTLFEIKPRKPHYQHGGIRGMAGKWEGEAFPARATTGHVATRSSND